jgi:Ca-activated chloride channel homolog
MKRRIAIATILLLLAASGAARADGFIVVRPPFPPASPTPFPLEVIYHHVEVEIEGRFAITEIDQKFYNPTNSRIEGFYLFPVPEGAVFEEFSLELGGVEMEAELLDAEEARRIYEDIVRQARDPALLEYVGRELYKLRVFPIEPKSELPMRIVYREALPEENHTIEYVYPLNTEKFSAKPLENVSVVVEIEREGGVENVYCPTHEVDVVRKSDDRVVVSYEERRVKPDIDFKLYYGVGDGAFDLTLLSTKPAGEDGYFFLSLAPDYDDGKSPPVEKDVTFVFDVSGSMKGEKIEQAREALRYCVGELRSGDRFQIVRFSTEARGLFDGLEPANAGNKKKADAFIDKMSPVGGTNMEDAFRVAFASKTDPKRPHFVVFVTDGKPTIGESDEAKLTRAIEKMNADDARIFVFGVGTEINTHLLDKIAQSTKAARDYIAPSEDVDKAIVAFFDKVESPALIDLEIDFGGGIDVYQSYPKIDGLPDLFKGSTLTILGRYEGDGDSRVILRGEVEGSNKRFEYDASFADDETRYDFVAPIWAARRIGHLLELIRLNGESEELVEEIVELARTHGIVTPYTSYLILEDELARAASGDMPEEQATVSGTERNRADKSRYESDYYGAGKKSGEESVQASEEYRDLNQAANYRQTRQGMNRYGYDDEVQQTRNVQGRAVYQNEYGWVDSYVQSKEANDRSRIQFASEEYFEYLGANQDAAQLMALGKNVQFYHNGEVVEIYE